MQVEKEPTYQQLKDILSATEKDLQSVTQMLEKRVTENDILRLQNGQLYEQLAWAHKRLEVYGLKPEVLNSLFQRGSLDYYLDSKTIDKYATADVKNDECNDIKQMALELLEMQESNFKLTRRLGVLKIGALLQLVEDSELLSIISTTPEWEGIRKVLQEKLK